jgi:hypothetical protein
MKKSSNIDHPFFYNNNKCELLETLDIKVIFMKKSSKLWSSTEREKDDRTPTPKRGKSA